MFWGILKKDYRTAHLMAPVLIEHLLKIEYRNRRGIFLAYGWYITANIINKVIFHFQKI